jgi:hypothetical protein
MVACIGRRRDQPKDDTDDDQSRANVKERHDSRIGPRTSPWAKPAVGIVSSSGCSARVPWNSELFLNEMRLVLQPLNFRYPDGLNYGPDVRSGPGLVRLLIPATFAGTGR